MTNDCTWVYGPGALGAKKNKRCADVGHPLHLDGSPNPCTRSAQDAGYCYHHEYQPPVVESPYITASKKVREAALTLADVDYVVAGRLHDVAQEVFEAEPKPDITLPDMLSEHGPGVKTPVVFITRVEGQDLQLVNWWDYKGWEVRIMQTRTQSARPLGYLHNIDDDVEAIRVGGKKFRTSRVDTGLKHLLGRDW